MNPSDIKDLADVERWLRHYVEWNDIASQDAASAALEVIQQARSDLDAFARTTQLTKESAR